jgi:NADPH:quinone reductase-like Zn-dependent oxidoreductase
MKAFYSTAYGGPEYSQYGDFPDPVIREGQVLIEVKAVSINPVDYKVKKGVARFLSRSKFPRVFGSDFSGVVRSVGSEVKAFSPGDRVYGASPVIWGKAGALAQLLAADEKYVRMMTPEMSFEAAASLPIAALTALNGLRRTAVSTGKEVLINGGTGGVGHFAIQAAKAKGARVTATCSSKNAELAVKLGASETMGYSAGDFAKCDKKFDAILDTYGTMKMSDINRLLKRGGTYATTQIKIFLPFVSMYTQLLYGRKLTSSNLRGLPEDMEEMEALFHQKKLVPLIENYFALEQAAEAFDFTEHGKPRGKVIVRVV